MRNLCFFLLSTSVFGCTSPESDSPPTQTDTAAADTADASPELDMSKVVDKILAEMEDKFIPGLAAALVIGDKVVWAEGFGFANAEDLVPVTVETPFMLASISKTFVGTALMQGLKRAPSHPDPHQRSPGLRGGQSTGRRRLHCHPASRDAHLRIPRQLVGLDRA